MRIANIGHSLRAGAAGAPRAPAGGWAGAGGSQRLLADLCAPSAVLTHRSRRPQLHSSEQADLRNWTSSQPLVGQ